MEDVPRSPLGRGLLSGGYVLVSLGLGVAFGYWASDWEVRFFPNVLAGILLLLTAGLALFAVGAQIEREDRGNGRLGRRAAASAILAAVSLVGIAAIAMTSRPTALTTLADVELRRTHELDARYFRELDRTLRGLVAQAESRHDLFSAANPRVPDAEEEEFLLELWASYLDTAMALDEVRRFHEDFYRFDLSRMERSRHVKSFLLSFGSELSLYESTTGLMSLLDANESAERFLNVPRPERSIAADSVAQIREELSGLTDLGRVTAGKRYLAYLDGLHQARAEMESESFGWLWDEVEHYIDQVESRSAPDAVTMSVASDFAPLLRGAKRLTFPVQKGVAEWMGDTRLKRAGGHYLVTAGQARAMEEKLEPGDVLLSRKNWYLSNIGLPGFWPHAILFVGTNEAVAASFDRDPEVQSWVRRQSGRELGFSDYLKESYPLAWSRRESAVPAGATSDPLTVIEAVSEGVIQNSVYGASGDFIVALRPRVGKAVRAQAIFRAFAFLDRPYDFDFDFATDHALVCTEVVWRAYRAAAESGSLGLEPTTIAGRLTLPANEIARSFREHYRKEDRTLDFVYYLEGREREQVAVVSGIEPFLATVERSKWDFGDYD